jgi:hypothetical protein
LAAAALLAPALAQPAIYKWVDEKGTTQYSDTLPRGRRFEVVPAPWPASPLASRDFRAADEGFAQRHAERLEALDEALRQRDREVELEAIARGAGTPVPGETFTEAGFQRKVLGALVAAEHALAPECVAHAALDTRVLGRDDEAMRIVERWVLDRCGRRVAWRIVFSPFYLRGHVPAGTYVLLDDRSSITFALEEGEPAARP